VTRRSPLIHFATRPAVCRPSHPERTGESPTAPLRSSPPFGRRWPSASPLIEKGDPKAAQSSSPKFACLYANDTLRREWRNAKPKPAKPISINAQVDSSGTAETPRGNSWVRISPPGKFEVWMLK
jgi:hypothetical protein